MDLSFTDVRKYSNQETPRKPKGFCVSDLPGARGMTPLDEQQVTAAERIGKWAEKTSPGLDSVLNVTGAMGTGKSTVLFLALAEIQRCGLVPIFLSGSMNDTDSAAVTLAGIVDQLVFNGLADRDGLSFWNPHKPWGEKFSSITAAVERHANRIVLVCDEPTTWYTADEVLLGSCPGSHARAVADWASTGTKCRRVISGYSLGNDVQRQWVGIRKVPIAVDAMESDGDWGRLPRLFAEAARRGLYTPESQAVLGLNLLKGLADLLSESEMIDLIGQRADSGALLRMLLDVVQERRAQLCEPLMLLTLLRTEQEYSVLELLAGKLQPADRELLESCFLVWRRGRDFWSLNPLVRKDVLGRMRKSGGGKGGDVWTQSPNQLQLLHERLGQIYAENGRTSCRAALESLHHHVLSGHPIELDDSRLAFVEQLQELGRNCSYFLRNHTRAAELFDLSLRLAPSSGYSHHYKAFNLDWVAIDEASVEFHYRTALEIEPTHPWYWSRWITYLLTRGRFAAARNAWSLAEDALCIGENSPGWIFRELHRWVARWLLHWGELDFAEYVLRGIPENQSLDDTSIQALFEMLTALREAENGRCVFPFTVRPADWWSPSPHTALPTTHNGALLHEWRPARISAVHEDGDSAFFTAARRPVNQGESAQFFEGTICRAEVDSFGINFNWADVSEGRFIEFGYYGETGDPLIAMHPADSWKNPHLLPLVPPPDRWYLRAVQSAWESAGADQ
jgi:tetratricopeptide (TPR) repeat protein